MKKKIDIKDALGNKVSGVFSCPKDASCIVILSHGFTSSGNSKFYKEMEKDLNSEKIATIRYDYYGHGKNYPSRYGVSPDTTLTKSVESLAAMIRYARKKGFRKIGLLGSSFGGLISLTAAAKGKIGFLVLRSPVIEPVRFWRDRLKKLGSNPKAWQKQGTMHYKLGTFEEFYLDFGFWTDIEKYDTLKMAKKISCPALIVHGNGDKVVPISQSVKLEKILGAKLHVVEGADHRYTKPEHYAEMKFVIKGFIIKQARK